MNLTELARKLGVPTKDLKEKLPELGFDIGMKAIKVPDDMAARIINKWREEQRRVSIQEKYADVGVVVATDADADKAKVILLPQAISVRDLADKFRLSPPQMIAELMKHGIMASLSEKVDFDIATIVAEGLGLTTELITEANQDEAKQKLWQDKLKEIKSSPDNAGGKVRPPVVVVMGHVDHGKTMLLDAIRKTKVIDTESGGITQHIGAYQVEKKGHQLTFLDTPGHEAFSAMRSRGANVADIAVLVVAADSGVQPQTIEAIKMIQDAGLPMIVAINKTDKDGADPERVKKDLSEINLIPEDWGGDVICVPVSAKTGANLDALLDMVVLVAQMHADHLKARYDQPAVGTIIESHLDKGMGPVATVLIHSGTLHVGDAVKIGEVIGKIRNMKNFKGEDVKAVTPSMPAQIIGLSDVPDVGDILEAGVDIKSLRRQISNKKQHLSSQSAATVESSDKKSKMKKLNIVLKADVVGSLEAISQSLKKYVNKQVAVNIVFKGLGNITEVDVVRAESTKAKIYGFHVSATTQAFEVAKEKGVDVKIYDVIYKMFADVESILEQLLDPVFTRELKAEGVVLAIFRGKKQHLIAGVKLKSGAVAEQYKVLVKRNGTIVGEGTVEQLRIGPEKVSHVSASNEFGLQYSGSVELAVGDELQFFEERQEKQTLTFDR